MVKYLVASFFLVGVTTSAEADTKPVCHHSPLYLVVERETGGVGTDFIIKKKGNKRHVSCDLTIDSLDFELKNERAEYFLAIQGDLLILDSGTGPDPRGLIIWNIESQKKVFSGSYSGPYTVENGLMKYWLETEDATARNCPSLKKNAENGLGSVIETRVQLNLNDFTVKRSSKKRCAPRQ